MIWPPLKAWTSKLSISGNNHFVAINYGEKNEDRWVILMPVLDGNFVVKVPWHNLCDQTKWACGWDEDISMDSSKMFDNQIEINTLLCKEPSFDSGLCIPITTSEIRPWVANS